jgi:hypothetical protein
MTDVILKPCVIYFILNENTCTISATSTYGRQTYPTLFHSKAFRHDSKIRVRLSQQTTIICLAILSTIRRAHAVPTSFSKVSLLTYLPPRGILVTPSKRETICIETGAGSSRTFLSLINVVSVFPRKNSEYSL